MAEWSWGKAADLRGEGRLLVVGSGVDVAESTTGGEELHGGSLGVTRAGAGGELGGADRSDVRAAAEDTGDKDVLVVAQALALTAGNTRVARGDEDRDALKTKLHPLVALTLLDAERLVSCLFFHKYLMSRTLT